MSEASFDKPILRAWRKVGHTYRWFRKLLADEHPNSGKAAAAFEDAMQQAMKADPAMNDVDRQEMKIFPRIVCLCGSTRFSQAFQAASLFETLAGHIVLSIGCDMRSDSEIFTSLSEEERADVKARLDKLHLRKIDLADEVFILNQGGYIGSSTQRELAYARAHGKRVRFLEPDKAPKEG